MSSNIKRYVVLVYTENFLANAHTSADQIYATNTNRSYRKQQGIITNFIPKSKQKLHHIEQAVVLKKTLNIARGTILGG